MLKYFNGEQIERLNNVISTVHKIDWTYGITIPKRILEKVNFDNLKVEDGTIVICDGARVTDYNHYSEKECEDTANEIKDELKRFFGLDAQVDFYISGFYEEEPNPLPPMYWGGTDTVYYYSLTIKVKL